MLSETKSTIKTSEWGGDVEVYAYNQSTKGEAKVGWSEPDGSLGYKF